MSAGASAHDLSARPCSPRLRSAGETGADTRAPPRSRGPLRLNKTKAGAITAQREGGAELSRSPTPRTPPLHRRTEAAKGPGGREAGRPASVAALRRGGCFGGTNLHWRREVDARRRAEDSGSFCLRIRRVRASIRISARCRQSLEVVAAASVWTMLRFGCEVRCC